MPPAGLNSFGGPQDIPSQIHFKQRGASRMRYDNIASKAYKTFSKLKRKLSMYRSFVRAKFGIDTELYFSYFSITLPSDHSLLNYKIDHKLYDRFLPHLCRYLGPGSAVIDVGANCGDTLAAMYEVNPRLSYVCVEADDRFFNYLQKNTMTLKNLHEGAAIALIRAFIGKNITAAVLEGSGGTKKAVLGHTQGILSATSLDDVFLSTNVSNVRLLKTDVDGFDYDVIESSSVILAQYSPLVFFEYQIDQPFQKQGYERMISALCSNGYRNWILFDNFGNLMLRTTDIDQIQQLSDYVGRQNSLRSTRTIFYFDVLAVTDKDLPLIDGVLAEYVSGF
jgi:FkbM family methyltransferase